MTLSGEGVLLRVFIGEADRHHGRPLSEVIVEAARKSGLAGATAWKGFMGFGAHSRMHTAKVLRLSTDLPVIIEIVDTREKIEGFLPELDGLVAEGLVTIERADVRIYRGPTTPRSEPRTQERPGIVGRPVRAAQQVFPALASTPTMYTGQDAVRGDGSDGPNGKRRLTDRAIPRRRAEIDDGGGCGRAGDC